MKTKREILIVAPPGNLQIGLQTLLTTHLDVDVLVTGEVSSALKVIETHKPAMVILDNDLPENAAVMVIGSVKSTCHETACIVMVNDESGRQVISNAGADLILLKGYPPVKLLALIKDQLL